MKTVILNLNWLELIFISLSIVSLVFNILQWRDRKSLKEPLSNALISKSGDGLSKCKNLLIACQDHLPLSRRSIQR